MSETAGRTAMRRILEQMRADPATLTGVVDAARAKSPPVAALPREEVQRRIAPLLAAVSSAFIDSGGLGDDIRAADRLAVDRALQGIPLVALLEGFQAGRLHVLMLLAERAKAFDLPLETIMDALTELDSYANQMQNRIVQAYRETEVSLSRSTQAARLEALRDLLHDGPASRIADTGLDAGRPYHCVITGVSDPREARRMETMLAAPGGLTGMIDGYLCSVVPRLPDLTPLTGADAVLAIAAPPVRPDRLPGVYALCRAALDSARQRGLGGVQRLTDLALAVAADAQPRLGELLADELLSGLNPADDFHRLLAETAQVYLSHGSRADLTAIALNVHPNTVKYRLRRFGDLTAFDPAAAGAGALNQAMCWWWALRCWQVRSTG